MIYNEDYSKIIILIICQTKTLYHFFLHFGVILDYIMNLGG